MKQRLEIRPRLDGHNPACLSLDSYGEIRADLRARPAELGHRGLVHAQATREGGLGDLPVGEELLEVHHGEHKMPMGHEMSTHRYADQALEDDAHVRHCGRMQNLKRIRKDRGLTQADLADLIGVNQATISKIERGSEAVTLDLVFRIAAALDVPAGLLFDLPDLHERVLEALSHLKGAKLAAALTVIEAMAQQ